MMFVIGFIVGGFIAGLLIAILVIVALLFFRHPIEKNIRIAETKIKLAGPRPKGYIFEPPEEAEEARTSIIEENRSKGLDTHVSDLE